MPRRFSASLLLIALSAGPLLAQATPDRVHYRDRSQDGKVVVVDGETKETASGVLVTTPLPDDTRDARIASAAGPSLVATEIFL